MEFLLSNGKYLEETRLILFPIAAIRMEWSVVKAFDFYLALRSKSACGYSTYLFSLGDGTDFRPVRFFIIKSGVWYVSGV